MSEDITIEMLKAYITTFERFEKKTLPVTPQLIETLKSSLELIKKYQKAIKELIETCDSYRNASDHCAEIFSDTIKSNYISKDKIKEKLESERIKALDRFDNKLDVKQRIYKRNIQIALIDKLKKELL